MAVYTTGVWAGNKDLNIMKWYHYYDERSYPAQHRVRCISAEAQRIELSFPLKCLGDFFPHVTVLEPMFYMTK